MIWGQGSQTVPSGIRRYRSPITIPTQVSLPRTFTYSRPRKVWRSGSITATRRTQLRNSGCGLGSVCFSPSLWGIQRRVRDGSYSALISQIPVMRWFLPQFGLRSSGLSRVIINLPVSNPKFPIFGQKIGGEARTVYCRKRVDEGELEVRDRIERAPAVYPMNGYRHTAEMLMYLTIFAEERTLHLCVSRLLCNSIRAARAYGSPSSQRGTCFGYPCRIPLRQRGDSIRPG